MKILNKSEAEEIRQNYISCFIDKDSEYYIKRVQNLIKFQDGVCYTGYLWDCYKNAFLMDENQCNKYIENTKDILVFWDIHSSERILIPNYWKFPKDAILQMDSKEFAETKKSLPEDIYVFDRSYAWSIAFTHEINTEQKRFCYFAYKNDY